MSNYLQLPAELQSLIEKRDTERRAAQRRAEESETPADSDAERRQNGDRRTLDRRQEETG